MLTRVCDCGDFFAAAVRFHCDDMADDVVWLALNSPGSAVHGSLGVTTGAVVRIKREAAR